MIVPSAIPGNDRFFCYLTGSIDARLVGYNVFLDGELEDTTHPDITKYPVVLDYIAGIAFGMYGVEIEYDMVFRSKEYTTQEHSVVFGAVKLSYNF